MRPIRWWPAYGILAVMAGLLLYFWITPMPSAQTRMLATMPILVFGSLLLTIWAVLFSRLPGLTRVKIFLGVVAIAAAASALFEIKEVDGNVRPIVGWRFGGERTFDSAPRGLVGATEVSADDYPQFYGRNRDARVDGRALETDWSAKPPQELWRREVGEGWSSFAIVGDAAVTQEQRGERELVVRYDLETGQPVWEHADDTSFNTTIGGSGPRATPTIADGRVLTLGATGILNALDLATGERLWSRNVLADNDGRQPEWGMSSSPLVFDGLVAVQLGRSTAGLAAYDLETGELRWRAGDDRGSYTTLTLATVAGREQILVVNHSSVVGHDPATGAVLWREDWSDPPGEKVTPALQLDGNRLLVSGGYGVGSRLLEVRAEGDGFAVEEIWNSMRLKSKFAPMVLHRGAIFGLDDGILTAIDPSNGERLWKRGRYGHGQFVLIGDVLLIQSEKGDVVLVDADPAEHRELARFKALDGKAWNPPALSGDLLLVRNHREAACYRLPVAG